MGFVSLDIKSVAKHDAALAAALEKVDGPTATQGKADAHEVAQLPPEMQDRYSKAVVIEEAARKVREAYKTDVQVGHGVVSLALVLPMVFTSDPIALGAGMAGMFNTFLAPGFVNGASEKVQNAYYGFNAAIGHAILTPFRALFGRKQA